MTAYLTSEANASDAIMRGFMPTAKRTMIRQERPFVTTKGKLRA
jgi:hypothetical protein